MNSKLLGENMNVSLEKCSPVVTNWCHFKQNYLKTMDQLIWMGNFLNFTYVYIHTYIWNVYVQNLFLIFFGIISHFQTEELSCGVRGWFFCFICILLFLLRNITQNKPFCFSLKNKGITPKGRCLCCHRFKQQMTFEVKTKTYFQKSTQIFTMNCT